MGLSIHYNGVLKNPDLIPALTEEISDLSKNMGWAFQPIQSVKDGITGIYFAPENCEPLFFTFNNKGKLINPVYLEHKIEPSNMVSVKTQYAGIDAHMAIIKLLRHLSKKYFSKFELMDEGKYWETNDEAVLKKQFRQYNAALDMLEAALKNSDRIPGEAADPMADRITKMLENINYKRE